MMSRNIVHKTATKKERYEKRKRKTERERERKRQERDREKEMRQNERRQEKNTCDEQKKIHLYKNSVKARTGKRRKKISKERK